MNAATALEPTLISMNDAAKMLGVPYYEIYNLSSSGRIGRVKKGTRVFVPQEDVRTLMETRQEIAAPIAWREIEAIPEDRKDGRDVLLWAGYAFVASWCDGWRDAVGNLVRPMQWADVEGPGR